LICATLAPIFSSSSFKPFLLFASEQKFLTTHQPSPSPRPPPNRKKERKNPFKRYQKQGIFFKKKHWPLQNKLAHFDHGDDYSLVIGCYEK
jgi:hypothetical protein